MSQSVSIYLCGVILLVTAHHTFSQGYSVDPSPDCGRCPPDHVCVLRPPKCYPGHPCILPLIPTCVPRGCERCHPDNECRVVDKIYSIIGWKRICRKIYGCIASDLCGGCPPGHLCEDTGDPCITLPCERYRCVPQNPCGYCRPGHVCVDTGRRCITAPCDSYKCVPLMKYPLYYDS